jgi:hypothetical protein
MLRALRWSVTWARCSSRLWPLPLAPSMLNVFRLFLTFTAGSELGQLGASAGRPGRSGAQACLSDDGASGQAGRGTCGC